MEIRTINVYVHLYIYNNKNKNCQTPFQMSKQSHVADIIEQKQDLQ